MSTRARSRKVARLPEKFFDEKNFFIWPPLLYIEPKHPPQAEPLIDELTRKMAGAFRLALDAGWFSCGAHQCSCGVCSTSVDYVVGNQLQTNSLCVHYLAFHRDEVPAEELAKVAALRNPEVEPTSEELVAPSSPR